MSHTYEQYIAAIVNTAEAITEAGQSIRLCEYVLNTLPDATDTPYLPQIKALETVAAFWFQYGLPDDGILPAIAIVSTNHSFGFNKLNALAKLQGIQDSFPEEVSDEEYALQTSYTYEKFCDDFAHLLN